MGQVFEMNRKALREQIMAHEGYRSRPYRDSLGYWTVGWGHLIHHDKSNIEQTLGEMLSALCDPDMHKTWLTQDIMRAELQASTWLDMESLSDVRQRLAVEMCFVLGGAGARKFRGFERAVKAGDHHRAAVEMVDSLWHKQAPNRVNAMAEQWAEG